MSNTYRDPMPPKSAADLVGCPVRIILAALHSGALPHRRWNARNFEIRRVDLIAWVKTLDYPRPEQPAQPTQPEQPGIGAIAHPLDTASG